jgi:hypothetical protein
MSLLAAVRHVIAMIAFLATLFVGFALVLDMGRWTQEAVGFAMIFTMLIGPVALAALALDAAFFRTNLGFLALNVNYSPLRMRWLATAVYAVLGIAPFVCCRLGFIRPSSSWIMYSPIWIAMLVHRGIMAWPASTRRTPPHKDRSVARCRDIPAFPPARGGHAGYSYRGGIS